MPLRDAIRLVTISQDCFLSLSALILAVNAYNIAAEQAVTAVKAIEPKNAREVTKLLTEKLNKTLPDFRYLAYVADLAESSEVKEQLRTAENCRRHAGRRKHACSRV